MRRKKLPIFEQVTIAGIGAKGKAVAWLDDKMAFVDRGVPGDVVDLQVTRKRKGYWDAKVIRVHQYSNRRAEPFCQHFGICGGCKWQDLPYEDQLKYKQKEVEAALEPLIQASVCKFDPILPAPATRYYRNKLEFTFSNRRWLTQAEIDSGQNFAERRALGFHIPGSFDRVLDIEECHLQPDPSNAIRQALRAFAIENQLDFYDPKAHQGLLRTLIIRTTTTGETMVVVVFHQDDRPKISQVMNYLAVEFPHITSLLYTINPKLNDTIHDLEIQTWQGKEFITERLGDLYFRIGPKSFFQTNTAQALRMYQRVEDLAGLSGHEIVYDLYTGTGTIANFVARRAAAVVGIEYIAEAIEDAKENSRLNQIENTKFFAGDIKDVLNPDFIQQQGKPDVLITDPPRAGMHPDVVKSIIVARPLRIVYVSCNPRTQATDLQLLQTHYRLVQVHPIDMFPHTPHVENIALLHLKGGES